MSVGRGKNTPDSSIFIPSRNGTPDQPALHMLLPATTSDIPRIRELAHRIWWAHYPDIITPAQIGYMLDMMYSPEALEQQMTREGIEFWLVGPEAAVCGFIAVSRNAGGDYFLHKFYLEPSRQGRGLGAAAFQALLEHYPDLRALRLTVNRRNFKSINFYFKVGFVIEKCVDIPIGQGFVMDDFQMLWRQKQPGTTVPSDTV